MRETQDIHARVASSFGANAAAYATSAGHNHASVLADLVTLVDPRPTDSLLDIATGAGHVALAFAPRVARSVALDLTPSMLEQVRKAAKERNLTNVETVEAAAESIPFADETFDIVTVRLAPHHFANVPAFLREVARVLKKEGKILLVDTTTPEDERLHAEIEEIERLRDPTHQRNYRPSEWQSMLVDAGLEVETLAVGLHSGGHRMEFEEWTRRIRTPAENLPRLREAFTGARAELADAMKIEVAEQITFCLPEITLLARWHRQAKRRPTPVEGAPAGQGRENQP